MKGRFLTLLFSIFLTGIFFINEYIPLGLLTLLLSLGYIARLTMTKEEIKEMEKMPDFEDFDDDLY